MVLLPKDFNMDVAKLDARLRVLTSSNYDGISKQDDNFNVNWKTEPSNADLAIVEIFWRDLTEASYNTRTPQEQMEYLASIYNVARTFGKSLIMQFALENIAAGITQAGKTRAVADYCAKLQYYMDSGSLYAALEEMEYMLDDEQNRTQLGILTWMSNSRINSYINKLKTFLGVPLS